MIPTVLETKRLILREFTEKDLSAFFEIFHDREVNRFLPWFPTETIEDAKVFWEERYKNAAERGLGNRYAVCLKKEGTPDGVPVGYINLEPEAPYDLGYGLNRKYWGQGIMTEAGKELVLAARKSGIPYITATHDRENPKSGEIMKRLGMCYRYSYREQWQPKNISVVFRMYQLNFEKPAEWEYEGYRNLYGTDFI